MEGFQIMDVYLKYFGFVFYNNDKNEKYNGFRYIKYYGGIDQQERSRLLDVFNKSENMSGEIIKIIMISPAGSEGISLNNVRQVHIFEPFWNETRIMQMIGIYILDRIAPSPQVEQKMQPQSKQWTHGNDFVSSSIGKGYQQKLRQFCLLFGTQDPLMTPP